MNDRVYLNDNWIFHEGWDDTLLRNFVEEGRSVRLPHTVKEVSFHYFDERVYQIYSTYQRQLLIPGQWKGRRLFLSFEGVAHRCIVYVNGVEVARHHCGYTPFQAEISEQVEYGYSNLITVRVDSTREAADYTRTDGAALYGGIYREACLIVRHPVYMEQVFHQPTLQEVPKTKGMSLARLQEVLMTGKILTAITLSEQGRKMAKDRRLFVCQFLDGKQISNQPLPANGRTTTLAGRIHLWDTASPFCYGLRTELRLDGEAIDAHEAKVGFRHIRWRGGGLELNGRRLALRGLIRRQSFPYVGEAMPESIQKEDARILKKELGVNAVRTANFPPSEHFISGCDEQGILVFEDIPGQQDLQETMENIKTVIRRDINHPSVIIWGMPKLREEAEEACRLVSKLDPARACAGIYFRQPGTVPEDVYGFVEKDHRPGDGDPADARWPGVPTKPILLAAFGKGMAEAGIGDGIGAKQEQLLMHAKILDAVAAGKTAGSFGEAMSDYFGDDGSAHSDGLCRCGVMDAFRNPKPAAFLYGSQPGRGEVLALSDDGPGGKTWLLTNAQRVVMYRDDVEVAAFTTLSKSPFHNMRHGPLLITDWLGKVLMEKEGLTARQNERIKTVFSDIDRFGRIQTVAARLAAVELEKVAHLDSRRLYGLYEKYQKDGASYYFKAKNDGKTVAGFTRETSGERQLLAVASRTTLEERGTYDVAAVRVRAADEHGRVLCHYDGILQVEAAGAIALIGPRLISFCGGYCGFYVKTTGEGGKGIVRIRTMDLEAPPISFITKLYRT